jgi:hypothetical protein
MSWAGSGLGRSATGRAAGDADAGRAEAGAAAGRDGVGRGLATAGAPGMTIRLPQVLQVPVLPASPSLTK